jgi:hypothetical protein
MDKTPASVGGSPTIKPQGAPGAPAGNANAGGAPGAPAASGAKPGQPQPPQAPPISPEDINRYKAIQQSLYPDLIDGLKANNVESVDSLDESGVKDLINYLLDIGWDSTYLSTEILKSSNAEDIKEFLNLVINSQEKDDEIDDRQFQNFLKQKDISVKQQDQQNKQKEQQLKTPAPMGASAQPGAMPPKQNPQPNAQPNVAPKPMEENPNLGKTSNYNTNRGESMSEKIMVSDGMIKTSASDSHEVVTAVFKATKAAELSIEKYRNASLMLKGAEALGESTDEFDINRLAADVQEKIVKLSNELELATDEKKKVEDPKMDKEFGDVISKGKDIASKGKGLFDKKDSKPEVKKDGPAPFGKKDGPDGAAKHELGESPAKEKKEEAAVGTPVKDEAKSLFASIIDRVKKEAQLYPAKDLNKQTVKNTNAENAKAQIKTIGKNVVNESEKTLKGSPIAENKEGAKNPSPKFVGKIKKEAFDNGSAKFKLATEMSAQQVLKGMLDNPLKVAMVKNMVEAGLDEKTAEAIAFNSFVDGFQETQELIMKEASSFVTKDFDEFRKIAEATIKSPVLEPADVVKASVAQSDNVILKSASVKGQTSYSELIREKLSKR